MPSDSKFKNQLKENFKTHSIATAREDLEKFFLSYMCSDEAEDSMDRQSATVTYQQLKKLLQELE